MRILGLGGITALVGLGYWYVTLEDRRQEHRLRYYEVIKAPERGPSRAVKEALEGLVALHDTVEKVKLPGAWLYRARLRGALLPYAVLDSVLLDSADLRGAALRGTHMTHAQLTGVRLDDANLDKADLSESRGYNPLIQHVWFRRGKLRKVNFEYALFDSTEMFAVRMDSSAITNSDFHNAAMGAVDLKWTDLSGTELGGTRLAGADLRYAKLKDIKNWRDIRCLEGANLFGVREAPDGFLDWAFRAKHAVSIESDALWKQARHELLRQATSQASVTPKSPVAFPISPSRRSETSYRVPAAINDTADAYAWVTITKGKPEALMFVIPGDTIADCLAMGRSSEP
ncbi:MAG TPA: pentapeptide repeat-containing protein [Gemmatimonadaceae bacterium]|jgi:uncharacterized protein YjbI with pentapeptide repeats